MSAPERSDEVTKGAAASWRFAGSLGDIPRFEYLIWFLGSFDLADQGEQRCAGCHSETNSSSLC